LYPYDQPDAVITADCIKVRLTPLVNSRFIEIAVNSDLVRQQVTQITKGVAQQKMSLGRFSTIALPLPPLSIQEEIVDAVDHRLSIIAQIDVAISANLRRAERLRQSILRKAFAGQLVPQDPDDEPATVLLEHIRAEHARAAGKRHKTRRSNETQYALW
jgi:type I restriction enzyme, S subunit